MRILYSTRNDTQMRRITNDQLNNALMRVWYSRAVERDRLITALNRAFRSYRLSKNPRIFLLAWFNHRDKCRTYGIDIYDMWIELHAPSEPDPSCEKLYHYMTSPQIG